MKTPHIQFICFSVAVFATGCAAMRPFTDAGLGAGGAYLAHELSAAGVFLGEGVNYMAQKSSAKAFTSGYDKGKSDAVKQQYWLQVAGQRQRNSEGNVHFYPVQLPEQRIDGAIFQPSTKYLRQVEPAP